MVLTVEVLDPMVLSSKVKEADPCGCEAVAMQIPDCQFSIIRLERDAQLVVPVLDYAMPCKECCDNPGSGEDPCEMFSRIPFPTTQFSPTNCDDRDCRDNSYQTC